MSGGEDNKEGTIHPLSQKEDPEGSAALPEKKPDRAKKVLGRQGFPGTYARSSCARGRPYMAGAPLDPRSNACRDRYQSHEQGYSRAGYLHDYAQEKYRAPGKRAYDHRPYFGTREGYYPYRPKYRNYAPSAFYHEGRRHHYQDHNYKEHQDSYGRGPYLPHQEDQGAPHSQAPQAPARPEEAGDGGAPQYDTSSKQTEESSSHEKDMAAKRIKEESSIETGKGEAAEGAGALPDRLNAIPPRRLEAINGYIRAKHRAEEEEAAAVGLFNRALRVGGPRGAESSSGADLCCYELLVDYFRMVHAIEEIKERVEKELEEARKRNEANAAAIPFLEPRKLATFLYDRKIFEPARLHRRAVTPQLYKGEEEAFKKGYSVHRKDFGKIREEFVPWRSVEELVLIYYRYKYRMRLPKAWQGVCRDARKITDAELREFVQREWTKEEMDTFERAYPSMGKKWVLYLKDLGNKTEGDVKAYYKYYKKFVLGGAKKPGRPKGRAAGMALREEEGPRKPKSAAEVLKSWEWYERQMFAILFPHIGKNWDTLAQYLVTKNAAEIRSYHRLYYKNLVPGERILESHLRDVSAYRERSAPGSPTFPRDAAREKKLYQDQFVPEVGFLFSSHLKS